MNNISTKVAAFVAACLTSSLGFSQVTLVSPTGDGGFETGTTFASNGWSTANQTNVNREWYCGTGQAGYTGARAAFIGNNVTTVGTNTGARTIHLYKSITLPVGASNIQVSFKYKQATADSTYDYTTVSAITQTPVANTDILSGVLTTMNPGTSEYTTFTTVNTTIPNSMAGSTFNLVFTWHSDNIAPHAYGAVDDVSVTYTPAAPCAGTPDAGVISGYGPVCSTDNFTLTLNNYSLASGLGFQWQSSTDGVTFADISGANSSSFSGTETTGTYYRTIVTCTALALSDTTDAHYISHAASCYCTASADDTDDIFEKITNVSIGTLNNSSNSFEGYENFISQSTDLTKGEAHNITVSLVNDYDQDHVIVFIDYNQDGDFTDAGETVYTSPIDYGPYTGSFTIPSTATNGPTRMRIRLDDSSDSESNSSSCGISGYGQVEDYTVNIICPTIPAPTGTDASTCQNTTASLSATSTVAGASFTWYDSSSNGTVQGTGSPLTTASLSMTTIYYVEAAIAGCPAGPRTAVTATVNPAPAPVISADGPLTFCDGNSVTLTTSSATGNTWSTSENTQSITVTTSGTYTVTETVAGCSGTSSPTVVTVNSLPAADAGTDQTICEGASATLTATGAGTFTWNNGVQQATPFTPASTMDYIVTVDNGTCTTTDTVTVTVTALPTVDAGTDQEICEGTPVTLTATGTGTFTWDNGVQQATPFTPSTTTTYTVTVGSGSCTATDEVTVTVNAAPTADAGTDQEICAGSSVALTATGTGTFTWNNGVQQATPFTPATTMNYVVTVDNGTCTATDTVTVTVNVVPTADAGTDQEICAGSSVALTATGTGTFTWNNGVQQATPFTPATTMDYVVTVDNGNCTATDTVTVTVNAIPTADAGTDQEICAGSSVALTATGTGTFTWNNGVQQATPFTPATTMNYVVTVDNGTCTATDTVTVTVNAIPTVDAGTNLEICATTSVTLTATGTGTFTWDNGVQQATPFTPTTTTTYTVTADNGNCTSTDNVTVTVDALPLAAATLSGVSTLTASPSGQTYQWFDCTTNTPIPGATSMVFTAPANGSYAVIVTNPVTTCSALSSCTIVSSVGIEETTLEGVNFFPNPTSGKVVVTMQEGLNGTATVYDMQGKLIIGSTTITNGSSIDLTDAQPGTYMIRLITANGTATNRVVKN